MNALRPRSPAAGPRPHDVSPQPRTLEPVGTAGYTFLYASDVLRAPQQINRTVNYSPGDRPPAPPQGPQEPAFRFRSSDFWAQGLNVGVTLRF